nr:putative inactive carboxylesterase 4 [Cherax quadricarinatus]
MLSVGGLSILVLSLVVAEDAPLVSTEEGWISGVRQTSTKGRELYAYHSIPFAQPPLNHLRLKDPVPAESWVGVKDGSKMPQPCLQVPLRAATLGQRLSPENFLGSEDCLYLNVYTPADKSPESELPVMVYIHGGAFFGGAANHYSPSALLNHDVVLVIIQYRLGVMGFLSTEDSVIPGNFGLKDQTLALQWVQRNINNFGGDKTKVTIFGESAGGVSVSLQMLAPKAKGLFSRVIMQSGTALAWWGTDFNHREKAEKIGQAFGCPVTSDSQILLECLQKVDGRSLGAKVQDFFVRVPHEDELLYLFQAEELLGPSKYLQQLRTPEDLEMRDIMSKLWTNFATTGNPTPDDSLGFTWEPSTEDNLHYLALNLKPTMEADRRQEVRKFFASLPLKMNNILYPDRVLQDHTLQQENSRRTMRNEL